MHLYRPSSKPWDQMTPREQLMETFRWSDSMGKANRAFLNEYGNEAYDQWRKSRLSMREFELQLRTQLNLVYPLTAPVADQFGE